MTTDRDKACREILAAKHESQVLLAVREYLDSLDVADAALLPAELLVMGLTPAEELVQSALHALHAALGPRGEGSKPGVLKDTADVFAAAARRLAALAKDPA